MLKDELRQLLKQICLMVLCSWVGIKNADIYTIRYILLYKIILNKEFK